MKFNLAVFKRGTMWWILGGIAFFILVWWLLSRGAPASASAGGTAYVQSGPSEAAQLQMASLGAQTSIAQAQIGADAAKAALESQTAIALATLAAQSEDRANQLGYNAALAQIDAQAEANAAGYAYNLETARLAAASQIDLANISRGMQADVLTQQVALSELNANILMTQMAHQSEMFTQQLQASTFQTLIGQVGSLKKKDRDEALQYLGGGYLGLPVTMPRQDGGGFLSGLANVISPIAGAIA